MYWLQFHGAGADGAPCSDSLTILFPSILSAEVKARELATTADFYWGRASGFRIRNEAMVVVSSGGL
jgi:hypothetical protein